jgi:hypothetical protein
LPIFGEKLALFLKTNDTIKIMLKLAVLLVKKRQFLQFFSAKIFFKITTSVPDVALQ